MLSSETDPISSFLPRNKSRKDTDPFDSPDSKRLIGRIFNREILPVPVWAITLSAGTAEPVRINCPVSALLSTSNLTASHKTGAICHSSINRGVSPFKSKEGLVSAMAKYDLVWSGSCRYTTLRDTLHAVLVLPHHFAPSISTAPEDSNACSSSASQILGK